MTEWGKWIEHTTSGRPEGVRPDDWVEIDCDAYKFKGPVGGFGWHVGAFQSIRRYRLPADHVIYKKDKIMEKKPSDAALERVREIYGWCASLEAIRNDPSTWGKVLKMAEELDRLGYKPTEDPLLIMAREIFDMCSADDIGEEGKVQYTLAKLHAVKGGK
jgi:hypothetical protein